MLLKIIVLALLPAGVDPALNKSFETNIRPILEKHCISCHGPAKQKGGLRLESAQAMAKGGDNGPVVLSEHPEKSLFLQVIRYDGEMKMPPAGKLKPAEIAYLEQWIRTGAKWPEQPASNPGPVAGINAPKPLPWWAKKSVEAGRVDFPNYVHPIDRFLGLARQKAGVSPAPPADRRTLLRRLSFDLTGLPPTPDEIRQFENDSSPDAFVRQIDRLLATNAYGEKWGRKWLDIVRYADSNGMDENLAHGPAWRYRNWVISAINRDLPYDKFLTWQIAGDLLPPVGNDEEMRGRLTATGFLSIGPKMLAEDDPMKMRMDIIDEQVDTIGQAFVGLTLGCARCHDHKYDPLTSADYYALAGIFKSTDTMENYSVVAKWLERPLIGPKEEQDRAKAIAQINQDRQALEKDRKELRTKRLQEEKNKVAAYLKASKDWLVSEPLRAKGQPGNQSLIVEAEDYEKGNVLKDRETYGVGIGVLVNRGELPNFTEYTVSLDKPGFYRIWLRYAAAEARPVQIRLDNQLITSQAADQATGSWTPESQKWFPVSMVPSPGKKVTVRLHRDGPFPHIDKLAFEHHSSIPGELVDEATFTKSRNISSVLLKRFIEYRKINSKWTESEIEKNAPDAAKGVFIDDASLDSLIDTEALKGFESRKVALDQRQKKVDSVPVVMAVKDGKVEDIPIHIRGNHMTLGKVVPRGFPEVFATSKGISLPKDKSGRLELAQWLTRPDHPLTARVMANRIWQGHFGTGIVRSVDNFGNLGEAPSHPELLDWLAREFTNRGWSIKEMHRLILTSQAWQQSTRWDSSNHLKDPDNRLLWRTERRRLNAEEFRDAMLAVSGKLDRQPAESLLGVADRSYVTSTANMAYNSYSLPKRSVYLPVVRSALFEFFQVFDFPDPSAMHGERSMTVVPTQALFLLNGNLLDESAQALAKRFQSEKGKDSKPALEQLILEVFGRKPKLGELEGIQNFLARHPGNSWKGLCRVLLSSNEFLYLD